jgi:hypothetical protein
MSVRTRVDAPQRAARRGEASVPRRAESAERVKSGAAQRAYARRRNRVGERAGVAPLRGRAASVVAGRIPFVAAIIALLACGLALTLLLTTRSAEDSYQLGDARRINQQLIDERAELERQVVAADAAPELADRARDLGMIPAKDPARLIVAPDGSVTVVGKETPAEGTPVPPLNTRPPSPAAPPPNQAQGERVVPVTTIPKPPAPNVPAAQAPAAPAPAAPAPGPNLPVPAPIQNGAPAAPGVPVAPAPGAPPRGAVAPVPNTAAPAAPAVPVPNSAAEPPAAPAPGGGR